MPPVKPPPYRQLNFGELDAAEEAIDSPRLLLEGFFDYRSAAYGITAGDTWLLLGPKGAGKTAVLEHLRLLWDNDYGRCFDHWNLQDFPVGDVSGIQTGEASGAARSQSGWQLILLLRLLASLEHDEALKASREFHTILKDLKKSGQAGDDWKTRVVRWSKASATIKLPVFELGLEVESDEVGTLQAIGILKKVLRTVETPSQHVLALDGLDQFFFELEAEWNSLAGLTHALASVNRLFRDIGQRISVVAAIRSDIFDVLPSPESNKLKPHIVNLDWSAPGIGTGSLLWQLVSAKARVNHPEVGDVVRTYLADSIAIGPHSRIPEYFLDYTRLLPRDLVALLTTLKQFHGGTGQVNEKSARECVKLYSLEYFVG